MTADIRLSQIGQIALVIHDLDRAVAFYRDALGLTLLFTAGPLAFFDCGGVRLMLTPPEKPEFDHPNSPLYFKVSDIRAAHAALTARGARFEDSPHAVAQLADHELWLASFRDPENNLLALMSEVPLAQPRR